MKNWPHHDDTLISALSKSGAKHFDPKPKWSERDSSIVWIVGETSFFGTLFNLALKPSIPDTLLW